MALHTRGLSDALKIEQSTLELWQPLAKRYGLSMRRFNGGIELRAPGRDKGSALLDLYRRECIGTIVVYVGDDETDEDAFRAVSTIGFGVRVGDAAIPSAATG